MEKVNEKIGNAKNSVKDFFNNFFRVLRRPEMVVLPGNLAFFFVLAIIPSLGLISYAASILNLSTDFLYNFIEKSFNSDLANLVLGLNLTSNAGISLIITLVVGLYIASNGADALIIASNTIYGIKNKNWFKRRIKALFLTFVIVLLLIFMLIIPVFGETIATLVEEVNLNQVVTNDILLIFGFLKGPVSWLIMFFSIKLLYTLAPDRKVRNRKRVINYGAWFTTFGWIIATKLFSLYVSNYANYSILYGGLATIVVLMLWLYLLSYIFTVGIALNSEKEENNLSKTGTIK